MPVTPCVAVGALPGTAPLVRISGPGRGAACLGVLSAAPRGARCRPPTAPQPAPPSQRALAHGLWARALHGARAEGLLAHLAPLGIAGSSCSAGGASVGPADAAGGARAGSGAGCRPEGAGHLPAAPRLSMQPADSASPIAGAHSGWHRPLLWQKRMASALRGVSVAARWIASEARCKSRAVEGARSYYQGHRRRRDRGQCDAISPLDPYGAFTLIDLRVGVKN